MLKYRSALTNSHNKYILPSDQEVDDNLELADYDGYIPVGFIRDLINIASYHIIEGNASGSEKVSCDYVSSVISLFYKLNTSIHNKTNSPVHIATNIIKRLHDSNLDFRLLESYRESGLTINESYRNTFNYKFDIGELSTAFINFLGITDDQLYQIEKLPEDILKILNFTNDVGESLFPSSIITDTEYQSLKSYGHIAKTNMTKIGRPDFMSKFAMKSIDAKSYKDKVIQGKKLVVGMSTNAKLSNHIQLIYKLIGSLILNHKQNGIKNEVILYIDMGNRVERLELNESIDLLKGSFQLSMFNQSNSKFLSEITFQEPNSTILFVPIFDQACALSSTSLNGCRINMLVPEKSNMIKRYRYMSSKTGGQVITI
jgi:hypothetical protein